MKAPEKETPISLREKVEDTLKALALLGQELKGIKDGKQIASSLEEMRAKVIQTDPTLIWQKPRLTRETNGTKGTEPVEYTIVEFQPIIDQYLVDDKPKDDTHLLPEDNQLDQIEELEEKPQTEERLLEKNLHAQAAENIEEHISEDLELDENFDDLALAYEATTLDADKTSFAAADESDKDDFEGIDWDDIDEREIKDLSSLSIHLRDIRQFPIQREKHKRWGEEVFVGEIALKALAKLSESELLAPSQKEKVLTALENGKFLLKSLDLRINAVNKRLRRDKYKNEQDKEYDRKFIEVTLANEDLVNEMLENVKGVEIEEEKEILFEQFSQRQIKFVNQGLESWSHLVEGNLRLVVSIAKKYHDPGFSLADFIQYGYEGLFIAAANYDSTRGEFSTYATWWIKQKIKRALEDYRSMVRLPVHIHEEIGRGRKNEEQGFQENGGLSDNLSDKLKTMLNTQTIYSLDAPIGESGKSTLKDIIVVHDQPTPEEVAVDSVTKSELKETINGVLATLPDRERRVIELRFGRDDDRARTLEEIGKELGVTKERIRQIEVKALRRLRHTSHARKLRSFIKDE